MHNASGVWLKLVYTGLKGNQPTVGNRVTNSVYKQMICEVLCLSGLSEVEKLAENKLDSGRSSGKLCLTFYEATLKYFSSTQTDCNRKMRQLWYFSIPRKDRCHYILWKHYFKTAATSKNAFNKISCLSDFLCF